MLVESLDPGLSQRLDHAPIEVLRDRGRPCRPPAVEVVVHEPLVLTAALEQRLPGLGFTYGGHLTSQYGGRPEEAVRCYGRAR